MLIAKLVHSQESLRVFSNGSKIKLLNRISDTNALLIGGISSCHSLCHPKDRKVLIRGNQKSNLHSDSEVTPRYTHRGPLHQQPSLREVELVWSAKWPRPSVSEESAIELLSSEQMQSGGLQSMNNSRLFSPLKVKAKSVERGGEIKDPFGAAVTWAGRRRLAINKLVWKLIRACGGRGGVGGGRQDGASSGEMGESLPSLMGCPSQGPGWRGLTCRLILLLNYQVLKRCPLVWECFQSSQV